MRPFYFTVLSCLFYVSTFLITVNCNIFVENFEQNSLSKWNLFEELVTTCYGENIGTIELNSFAAYEGLQGMVVWSNKNKTKGISNHIIAGNKVFSGVEGRWRYSLHAQIPLASFETTQVGPEFSVQNTRDDGTNTGTTRYGICSLVLSCHVVHVCTPVSTLLLTATDNQIDSKHMHSFMKSLIAIRYLFRNSFIRICMV